MNRPTKIMLALLSLFSLPVYGGGMWHAKTSNGGQQMRSATNAPYIVYSLDEAAMKQRLGAAAKGTQLLLDLPLPDGTLRSFKVWENDLLPAELAAKYPDIKTYTAEATDDATVTAKIEMTTTGFHAMIYDGDRTSFVNPLDRTVNTGDYKITYKKDEQGREEDKHTCQTIAAAAVQAGEQHASASKTVSGYQLRTYRIAIGCDHQYAIAATGVPTPTKAGVLSYIVSTMNRVNGVYERELSVTMTLVAHEDTLIYNSATGDPFGAADNNPYGLMTLNQQMCDSLIGTANYDMGHIFSTGAGGLSTVGCVCNPLNKAQSVTGQSSPTGDGFDIDYVAHEMGHEFGADHTFNNNVSGSCSGNANRETAFEPGSGSTIMAYAGICGGDNLQPHSDAYFTTKSLLQIFQFVTHTGDCAVKTNTNNAPPALIPFTAVYEIPYQTPFELTAPVAVDSVADTQKTYCWEQWNLGDFERTLNTTELSGPLFRSYTPDTSRTRIFPNIEMVLAWIKSNAGTNNAEGEKLPTVARFLTFRLTTRNIFHGSGCFQFLDDSIHLNVSNTGRDFSVTSQSAADLIYIGNSLQTVSWDVANTIGAPINTSRVDIYLSVDGGHTWPYFLGNYPNNGSAVVTMPSPAATTDHARIKVKGAGNVFFNVNKTDFTLINNPGTYGDILVFPIPARNLLTVVTGDKGEVTTTIHNLLGRLAWMGDINGILNIDVSSWPRGMYVIRLTDVKKQVTVKKLVLY